MLRYLKLKSSDKEIMLDLSKNTIDIIKKIKRENFSRKNQWYSVGILGELEGSVNFNINVLEDSIGIEDIMEFYDNDFNRIDIENYGVSRDILVIWRTTKVNNDNKIVLMDFDNYVLGLDSSFSRDLIIKLYAKVE